MSVIISYILSIFLFAALDIFWLGFLMNDFYQNNIGKLGRSSPLISIGIIVWVLIVGGIFYFVLPLSINYKSAFLNGLTFGFILYSVYELTNYLYITNWPFPIVIVDILWGSFVCSLISVFSFLLQAQ
ncbi:MAG: DUF2177 family protein [Candidatus Dependentiae bacterium]